MDDLKIARELLPRLGGEANIRTLTHCATRLRLTLVHDLTDLAPIEDTEGVKGVFKANGQLQIIFGTGKVDKVYDALCSITHFGREEAPVRDLPPEKPKTFWGYIAGGIKKIGDVFIPIIPAIVASGLIMGVLEGLGRAIPSLADSSLFTLLSLFSNAAFNFLPILIGYSAANAFGANPYLGAVLGGICIHPNLLNAWSLSTAEVIPHIDLFGILSVPLVGYQGHVIPILLSVLLLAAVEKRLHKIVPEMIDLFVTPLVSVLISGFAALLVIGPVFASLETRLLGAIAALIRLPFGIGGFLAGAIYAPTVVTGLHHMYNAIEAGLLSESGQNIWMPIATAANVAQGAACLAVFFRSKNKKTRSVALPAALSASLGITEPAIFGVNLRFLRPFIGGIVGGAVGGLVASWLGVYATAYGVTGLFGLLITTSTAGGYILTMLTAAAVGFCVSFALGVKEERV